MPRKNIKIKKEKTELHHKVTKDKLLELINVDFKPGCDCVLIIRNKEEQRFIVTNSEDKLDMTMTLLELGKAYYLDYYFAQKDYTIDTEDNSALKIKH